jgi:hypothetical protein
MSLQLYYNIVSLVQEASIGGRGFPWKLAGDRVSQPNFAKNACPTVDSLFVQMSESEDIER